MPTIDIIGDIHGYADKLRRLLSRLGYVQNGGVYSSPDRTAIFVGDLIDRGPAIGEVIEIVAGMLRAGAARIVMGNHEFNALAYHTLDEKGEYLREHIDKNDDQHAKTLAYFDANPGAKDRALTWFYSFPLWLDLGFARIVHAAWSPKAVGLLETPYLSPKVLVSASTKGTSQYWAVETLLKGVEASLPDKIPYFDKDGHERTEIRVRWWLKPDAERTDDAELKKQLVGTWNDREIGLVTVLKANGTIVSNPPNPSPQVKWDVKDGHFIEIGTTHGDLTFTIVSVTRHKFVFRDEHGTAVWTRD
jgi:Calcineurin-like phosphoesterase